jgi:single-strand DNA-binding protein
MSYELEGTLKEIFETKTFGKGFTKREFVVTTSKGPDDRYPQHIKMTLIKDKVSLLDRYRPGQRLKVTFDLRGSESNGRYYTDLQAWKLDASEGGGGGGGGASSEAGPSRRPPPHEPSQEDGERTDGMPF